MTTHTFVRNLRKSKILPNFKNVVICQEELCRGKFCNILSGNQQPEGATLVSDGYALTGIHPALTSARLFLILDAESTNTVQNVKESCKSNNQLERYVYDNVTTVNHTSKFLRLHSKLFSVMIM